MPSDRCMSGWLPVLSCLVAPSVTLAYCGQTVGWIKMPVGMEVGHGLGHIVLDEDPAPLPKNGTAPQFWAHVYSGQTAGWIKMPVGMEVGYGPSHIVLDGDPTPPPRKWAQPSSTFRPMFIAAKLLDGSRCHLVS